MSAIRVELELVDGSFTSRLIHAGESVDQFTRNVGQGVVSMQRMEKESEGLLSSLRDVTVTLAVAGHAISNLEAVTTGWAGQIVQINAEVERMKALMVSLSTAADPMAEATVTIDALRESAKNAPFSLQAMHDTFIRLKTTGIDPMTGSMTALTDAVAAFGGDDQSLHRASLAIQEMSSKGVVQMKELRNQLGAAIPNSLPLLARAMGVSYEELMSDIHTGTVNAKEAIAALEGEFERTFGGAGQRQMETFNGQIARMQVNLQQLAIHNVGDSGYFDAVKAQLNDFNSFLEGSTAKGFGNMLGQGLTEGIAELRKAIDTVVEFKDEISAAGEVLLYAFGAKMAWAGVTYGVQQIQNLGKEVTLLGTAWNVMGEKQRVAALLNSTVMMGEPMISGWSAAFRGAGAAVEFAGLAIGTVLPWLAILGPALAAAAEYFGLFHNKAEEAYDSLERFGAKTEEEANKADDYLKQLNARIESLEKLKKVQDAMGDDASSAIFEGGTVFGGAQDGELKDLYAKRDAVAKNVPKMHEQGLGAESKQFVEGQIGALQEVFRAFESEYNKASTDSGKLYEENFKRLNGAHKDTAALTAKYQEDERARNMLLYSEQEDSLEKVITKARELQALTDPKQRREGADLEAAANQKLVEVQRQRRAEMERPMGVSLDAKVIDPEKLYGKGQEQLEKIRDQINGFKAGLEGLDPHVAELQSLLDRGFKFGDTGVDRVRELIDAMTKAKGEADALNEAMKGRQKLDNDLKSLNENLDERMFKAQHGDMSETDALKMKVNDGKYAGVGPNKAGIDKIMDDLATKTKAADVAAQGLGTTLLEKVFGGTVKTQAEALNETLDQMRLRLNQVSQIAGGVKLPNPYGSLTPMQGGTGATAKPMFQMMQELIDKGATPEAAAGFVGGTSMESGKNLDPAASNGTHIGVAQWDGPRWAALQQQFGDALQTQQGQFLGVFSELANGERKAGGKLMSGKSVSDGLDASDAYERPGDAEAERRRPEAQSRANALLAAYNANKGGSNLPTPDGLYGNEPDQFASTSAKETAVVAAENTRKLVDAIQKMSDEAGKSAIQFDETRKHYADAVTRIKAGDFGTNKDPNSSAYKPLLDAANSADGNDKTLDDNKKARSKGDTAIEDIKRDLLEQQARYEQIWVSLKDGAKNSLGTSSEILRDKGAGASRAQNVKDAYGADSEQYKDILAENQRYADGLRNEEIAKNVDELQKKTTSLRDAVKTQEQSQEDAYQHEVARLQKELDAFTGTQEQKQALMQKVTDYETAYRAKQLSSTPLAKEFQDWSDITKNAQQMTANWVNSTTDAIADMVVTGKTNWKSLTQSMESDLVKMALHGAIGGLGSGLKGGSGGIFGSLFGAASGGGGIFGVGHNATGDNNWQGGPTWVGEKGPEMVDLPAGSNIVPAGSAPAMTQPQDMAAAQNVNVTGGDTTNHVTVSPVLNATGGSPQQNADLAAQMGKHVEDSVRRVFADEMRSQMRPGGALDGTKFTR